MATTASRVVRNRPTTKSAAGGKTASTGRAPASRSTAAPPRATTAPAPATPLARIGSALREAKKPGSMNKLMDSIQSVQESPAPSHNKWPLWRKIALWAVMLMPAYAIVIYLVGGLWFLPAELSGVGVNKSLPTHVLKVVDGISIPDQEGVFMQAGTDPKQPLNMILQFNDRSLMPPLNQQFTTSSANMRYILIRQAQVSLPTDYQVLRVASDDTDHAVPGVVAQRINVAGIALIALFMPAGQHWAPGSYVINVPQAGLDDETDYCFFTITK